MKKALLTLCKNFGFWLMVMMAQKPLFMLWNHRLFGHNSLTDWLAVIYHGLTLDVSLAAYLTAGPMLTALVGQWVRGGWRRRVELGYYAVAAVLVAMTFVINIGLYDFWKFPLDTTPLFYFLSSPKDAFASVSVGFILVGLLAIVLVAALIFWGAKRLLASPKENRLPMLVESVKASLVLLVLAGLLIIPIRGGVTVSTTNTGKVYFSERQELNHAAVNPLFSLMESFGNDEDFGNQYRFMTAEEASEVMKEMVQTKSSPARRSLLRADCQRPDVYIIVLESFSNKLMKTLGGEPDVAVNLDRLGGEGVLFTRFYANSFRTDRGLVSVLSGFPAQPTMSLMKFPRKTTHLPSIAGAMKAAGYGADYYYGGDADFTNMRSYLVNSGFEHIVSDVDFPVKERLSKWGVPDHLVFERLLRDLRSDKRQEPMLRVLQTSSSHEPFDVPYHRLANNRLNAFAYTDDCVGKFIGRLKQTDRWKNSLVILVPDHQGCYPEDMENTDFARYEIPLIWVGGALAGPCRVDKIGSQNDIAATLLGQLGIDHGAFKFSKDLLAPATPSFAWFAVPDLLGMVTENGAVIYDNKLRKEVNKKGDSVRPLRMGQAWLQSMYDYINDL
ncbi:LTA synthase family protein [Prevotella sp.]|uniref:LTA synthase family protein n=1 Tax=Prevotella sp. TaxID=59823 RepID=UPI002F91C68B